MATRTHRRTLRLVSIAFLAAVLWHRGAEAGDSTFCVDKSSPSAKMDVKVAQAASRLHGDNAKIVWFDGDADDDGYSLRNFIKLANNDCQLILGYPVDAQTSTPLDKLRFTTAYARTGFVLVSQGHAPGSLDKLPQDSTVGVTYLTAPNLYFAGHTNLKAHVFLSDKATLQALQQHKIAAAMLWRPFLVSHLHDKAGENLTFTPLEEPHASWNLVALYADSAQPAAKQFEQDIESLARNGQLAKLLQPFAEAITPAPVSAIHPRKFIHYAVNRHTQGRLLLTAEKKPRKSLFGPKPPPALYTEAQATTGKAVFANNCAVCHGPNLEGRAGPALKGHLFASPQAKFTVGDIFRIVSLNMPAPAPGSLPHEDYVNVMSFVLQQNGYPSGETPLTYAEATESKAKLLYYGK